MFTHMVQVKRHTHQVRSTKYELFVYRVVETGEHRIYVVKDGFGVGDIFTASEDVVFDAKKSNGWDVVGELIAIAKGDIDRDEFGLYSAGPTETHPNNSR
jgi:hypothetical protein